MLNRSYPVSLDGFTDHSLQHPNRTPSEAPALFDGFHLVAGRIHSRHADLGMLQVNLKSINS